MTIDYSSPGKVIFSMIDYIGKMLNDITENMKGESAKPSAQYLFDIAEDEKNYTKPTQISSTSLWHSYYIFHREHVQTSS